MTEKKKPVHRKPLEPLTEKDIQKIEAMSGLGMPMDKIALVMDMHKSTLGRRMKKIAATRDAVERGQAKASAKVRSIAFNMATDGKHPAMTIFWLKTREGFRETDRLEITGAEGGSIKVSQLSPEERKAEIKRLSKIMQDTEGEF